MKLFMKLVISNKKTQKNYGLYRKKVKVIGNVSGHGFVIGSEITITGVGGVYPAASYGTLYSAKDSRGFVYNVYESDISPFGLTKDDIEKTIVNLKSEISELNDKISYWEDSIKFMDENSLKQFDEMEFKSYRVLKTINEKTSDLEKAQIIAKIING